MKQVSDPIINKSLRRLLSKIPIKLTVMLLFFFTVLTTHAEVTYAQATLLSLNIKNAKVESVLDQIEQNSEFYFLYNSRLIDVDRIISVNAVRKPVQAILDEVFKGTDIEYSISDRQIILSKKVAREEKLQQMGKRITGVVVDNSGEPVIGATVMVEGTSNGTVTGIDGDFTLTVPENARLQITYVGYNTQFVSVAGKDYFHITISEDVQRLEEVVVIGYGTQKKVNLTGSVASISAEQLSTIPVSSISNAMAGRMPGVFSNNRSSAPGSTSPITIRGKNTPNHTDPTYVIDGVVREKDDFDGLDPNEIETISILKDAASAAVYGAKAANGVILVTTKRGQNQKPQFRYTGLFGTETPTRVPQVMTAYERALYMNQRNTGNNVTEASSYYSQDEIDYFKTHNYDWWDMATENPFIQQHNLSVNGGSEQVRYFMSLGYYNHTGIIDNYNYDRYNFRSNVDAKITKDLTIGLDIDANLKKRHLPYWPHNGTATGDDDFFKDLFRALMNFPRTEPAYVDGRPNATIYNWNVLEVIKNGGYKKVESNTLNAKLTAAWDVPFVEGLRLSGLFNYRKNYDKTKQFGREYTLYIHEQSGANNHIIRDDAAVVGTRTRTENGKFVRKDFGEVYEYTLNFQANYNRSFGKHDVGALFVYEQYERFSDSVWGQRKELLTDSIDEMFIGNADNQYKDTNGSASERARIGYVGRVNYGYDSRYLLEANFRYDGNVKWAPGKRWGFFPSVSGAWRITEEQFFKNLGKVDDIMDNLKLRVSYGILGNDGGNDVAYYQYLDKFSTASGFALGSGATTGLLPGTYPNKNITWEKTETFDVGFDVSMWNGLFSLEFDYFRKRTYDILMDRVRVVPETFGATLPKENYAELINKGVDFLVRHDNKIQDINYYVSGNFSFARNHYSKIDEAANAYDYQKKTGRPMNFWTGYLADGILRTEEQRQQLEAQNGALPLYSGEHVWQLGDILLRDIAGPGGVGGPDGVVDGNDQTVLSLYHKDPEIIYGFSIGAEWKGLDFNIFFQGVGHRTVVFENRDNRWGEQTVLAIWNDAYSPENINSKYPRVSGDKTAGANGQSSSFWLMNGNYLRCKNLELGYTFPRKLLSQIGVSHCRVYVSGTNLFVFDKIGIYDPENSSSYGAYQYPLMKSYNVGLTLSF